jgi:branched-chain amino acid transport system permease protein
MKAWLTRGNRSWWAWGGFLLVLPFLLPWFQFLAFYLIWPLAWVSDTTYAGAYRWVASFLAPTYMMRILILMGLQAILALGLNLVSGFCGLLDLGYVAFYCVGAYTAAILVMKLGWSYWLAMVVAGMLSALVGVLRGFPTLTLAGDYYAIVTFGFAELVVLATKNWTELTGGAAGLPGIPAPTVPFLGWSFAQPWVILGMVVQPPLQYYYLMVLLLLACLLASVRV